jgi:hypothetical protein
MSTVPISDGNGAKVCTKCGLEKPLDEYYVKEKSTGRRFSRCKPCHTEGTKANHRANREREAARQKAYRLADLEKARRRDAEYREKNRETLRERERERAQTPEYKAKKAAYRASRTEERRSYNARYREEHAADVAAYNKRYYEENKEAVSARIKECVAKNPDLYRQIHSDWKKANKDAVIASGHRRRARLKHNGGSWSEDDWQRVKARYNWRCLMCGQQEITDGITLCFDHVVPLSVGGYNIISNAQPLCRSCNSKKHRKVLDLRPDFY